MKISLDSGEQMLFVRIMCKKELLGDILNFLRVLCPIFEENHEIKKYRLGAAEDDCVYIMSNAGPPRSCLKVVIAILRDIILFIF